MIGGRHVLVLGTFLLAVLLYVDRVCISTARDPITRDLDLTDTEFGWVLSSFALGYALFQTPTGMLADRYGPRLVLAAVVVLWSRVHRADRGGVPGWPPCWSCGSCSGRARRGRSPAWPGRSTPGSRCGSGASPRGSTSRAGGSGRRSPCRPWPGWSRRSAGGRRSSS